jgi:hypothetical protein
MMSFFKEHWGQADADERARLILGAVVLAVSLGSMLATWAVA